MTRPRRSITLRNTCFMPTSSCLILRSVRRSPALCRRSPPLPCQCATVPERRKATRPTALARGCGVGAQDGGGSLDAAQTARAIAASLYLYLLRRPTPADRLRDVRHPCPGPGSREPAIPRLVITMTEDRHAAITKRGPGSHPMVLDRVLLTARLAAYEGYSKHDALNSAVLARLAGQSRLRRIGATQVVTRSPIDVRHAMGVRKARNAKGLSLFARAYLSRHRMTGSAEDASEARDLLDWLISHSAPGFDGLCWGYPYPWQDVGFFAPRDFPNRVVTSFVGQALLDGYETLRDRRYLDAADLAVPFLPTPPNPLYQDDQHWCLSYVPDSAIDWIVMDVSALVGTLSARLGAITGDEELVRQGGRLIRYVVSKQTDHGAWFYTAPPSASHITHDNYHTGFILDSILQYGLAAGSEEFQAAYSRGVEFYARRLFGENRAAKFLTDRQDPPAI